MIRMIPQKNPREKGRMKEKRERKRVISGGMRERHELELELE